MTFRCYAFLITFDMEHGFAIRSIGHGCDHTAHPVEVLGGDFSGGSGQVAGCRIYVSVERSQYIKCIGCKRQPLDRLALRAHLDQSHDIITVDANGTVCSAHSFIPIRSIRIIGGSLIMGRQHVFYILHRDLLLRHHAPGQIIRKWRVLRIRTIPTFRPGIQGPQHVPGSCGIVYMVRIVMAAKGISGRKAAVL